MSEINKYGNPFLIKGGAPLDPLNFPLGSQHKLMQRLPRFRYILPPSTTTSAPILQQAWEDMGNGQVEWRNVETVIVSDEEFAAALSPSGEK